jgi:glycosyltransferase involved in cell wall biosynthesis
MSRPLEGQRLVHLVDTTTAAGPPGPVAHYCRALLALGAEVHQWTLEGEVSSLAPLAAAGAHTRALGCRKMGDSLHTSRVLRQALAEVNPDWIHAHSFASATHASRAVAAGIAARLVITHHDSTLRWRRRLMTYPYRNTPTCVIFQASGTAEHCLRWYGYPPERAVVLPLPIDVERFAPGPPNEALRAELGLQEAYPIITWAARLHRHKGHDDLLRAFPAVLARHPAARMVFPGRGRHEGVLHRLTARLGLSDQILFPGLRRDMPDLLRLTDVFVCPSLREALCQAVQEAMATANPVVCTRVWSAGDLIEEEVSGLTVPIGSSPALAEAINRLADDRVLAERLGQAARERALERWAPEVFARGLGEIYEKLVRSRSGTAATLRA